MATVTTTPDPLPSELPCPCKRFEAVFEAKFTGSAYMGPVKQYVDEAAKDSADAQFDNLKTDVETARGNWRAAATCKQGCTKKPWVIQIGATEPSYTYTHWGEKYHHGELEYIHGDCTLTVSCSIIVGCRTAGVQAQYQAGAKAAARPGDGK